MCRSKSLKRELGGPTSRLSVAAGLSAGRVVPGAYYKKLKCMLDEKIDENEPECSFDVRPLAMALRRPDRAK